FYDTRDHGVPYIEDISFIGSQFEFRRDIPWMDDDAAGFGASRADYEDKVVAGNTFDYVYTHGEAISAAGRGFISSSVEAFCRTGAKPGQTVDLILGKQKETAKGRGVYGTKYKTFPAALQERLREATAGGSSVFVSGSYVATDLWDNPHSSAEVAEADKKFAREVLGYNWRVGQATVEGGAYEVDTRFPAFTGGSYTFAQQLNGDIYAVESPDSFFAADPKRGCTLMRYTENNLVAGIAFQGDGYRTVVLGFPFETIDGTAAREGLMNQILNFFK
ncbi:MAG: xanthan lyase, partial [Muribaculaceae bacterium]|nr:xanthan lyase [Muribaculaceae bacterium]